MAHLGTVTRTNRKLVRNAKSWKITHEERDLGKSSFLLHFGSHPVVKYSTSNFLLSRPRGLIPFDPENAPASKDLRTPYVPRNGEQHSLWKQTKDGAKNQLSTRDERRQVKHPSLYYRQDHEDRSWLFRSTQLGGHDNYRAYKPRSNYLVISLSLMALLVHVMTREENDLDVIVQKQGWYRLLWINAPYDSSKDPRSNKGVGQTVVGVPIIKTDTLLNNSKDE